MNMSKRLYALGTSGNPVVQVLSLLAFGVLLIGAVLMGAVVMAVVFGFAVIAAAVLAVRLWWLRRRMARTGGGEVRQPGQRGLIEAEYRVVSEQRSRDRERR